MPNRPASNGRQTKRATVAGPPSRSTTLDLDELQAVLAAVRKGDFSVRMRSTQTGLAGKVADTLNDIGQG
jgi:hypothetical protein